MLQSPSDGLIWNFANCPRTNLTIEFRYSTIDPVPIQILVGNSSLFLSDGSSTINSTADQGVNFMRKNFVIGPIHPSSFQTIQITRTNAGSSPLYIHRMNICTNGAKSGCPRSFSSDVYCYKYQTDFAYLDNLSDASGTIFTNLQLALLACSDRMDCLGVVSSVASPNVYQLMGGSFGISQTTQTYIRTIGLGDGNQMCVH